jgi:hypothetical protein
LTGGDSFATKPILRHRSANFPNYPNISIDAVICIKRRLALESIFLPVKERDGRTNDIILLSGPRALASWTSETWTLQPEMWTLRHRNRVDRTTTTTNIELGKNYNISYLDELARSIAKCFVIDAIFATRPARPSYNDRHRTAIYL